MARWTLADRLNLLLVALMIATAWGPMATRIFDFNHEPGCDTIQFYVAGQMVNRGEGHRLLDQSYFQEMQGPIVGDAGVFYSLYPPITAVLAAPWARLSYHAARNLWWIVEVALIFVAGWMFYRQMDFPRRWRVTAMLALATIFPMWVAIRMGQTTPVWLLTLLGGIELHRRNHRWGAGLLLSLLAMKPQLAAPVFVWLLFRRDLRVIFGMMLGAAAQATVSAIVLGPEILTQYAATLLSVGGAIEPINFSPAFEQSVGGTLKNLLITNGWRQPQTRWPALLAQLAVPYRRASCCFRPSWQTGKCRAAENCRNMLRLMNTFACCCFCCWPRRTCSCTTPLWRQFPSSSYGRHPVGAWASLCIFR